MEQHNALFIQRFITLLDDYHFEKFIEHLVDHKATLPAKLCRVVRKKLPKQHNISELYKAVYGSSDAKKGTLHQLTSHTIKLSSFLSKNYPNYLAHNISKIEIEVNNNHLFSATILAENLVVVSYKTGDFETCIKACLFLIRHKQLTKADISETVNVYEEAKENAAILQGLYQHILGTAKPALPTKAVLKDVQQYFGHKHPAVSIFSKYVYLTVLYQYNLVSYETKAVIKLLDEFEKQFKLHAYLCFPYMLDMKGDIALYKLNSPFTVQNSETRNKGYTDLSTHYETLLYGKTYAVPIQLTLISTQLTMLLTKYHYQIFKDNYQALLSREDKNLITILLEKCDGLLADKSYGDDEAYRKLIVCRAALKILAGGKSMKDGIQELESFLTVYQQINLQRTTGTIYFFLIMANFALKRYDTCVQLYRGYGKVAQGKGIYMGNHLKILAFYYFAKWQIRRSPQYITKVKDLLTNYTATPQAIVELAEYCKMPVFEA